jgi:O-methyltransferase involved in polyketide biosynthesis
MRESDFTPQEPPKEVENESFEALHRTAWLTAYPRTFTDIPLSSEIYEELEQTRIAHNEPGVPDQLKYNRLAPQLEARYKLINRLIAKNESTQIVELAAGLSPRGLIATKDKGVTYVEMDLPAMVGEKQTIIDGLTRRGAVTPSKNFHLIAGSALEFADIASVKQYLDIREPVTIVNEGLLRYFSLDEKAKIARNIRSILETQGGAWITPDITTKAFLKEQDATVAPGQVQQAMNLTGRDFHENRFEDVTHAQQFFEKLGFAVTVHRWDEVRDELSSPKRLAIDDADLETMLEYGFVFEMRAV